MADPKKDAMTLDEMVYVFKRGFEWAMSQIVTEDKKDAVRVVGMCNGCDQTIMIDQETRLCEKCTKPKPPTFGFGWVYGGGKK